jgi:DUF2950 family protein
MAGAQTAAVAASAAAQEAVADAAASQRWDRVSARRRIMNRLLAKRAAVSATIFLCGALICSAGPLSAASRTSLGKAFPSKEAAAQAFIGAVRAGDDAALIKILGPQAQAVVNSGDPVADRAVKNRIASAYDQMHRFVATSDGRVYLYVGAENWPLPIPLMKRQGKWYFDTAYGKEEILARRIGKNELDAIQVCRAVVAAQHQYTSQVQAGEDAKQYAQKFLSDEGKHNGLYWTTAASEPPSPLGPLIVSASAEGYRRAGAGKPTPYHGYIYRLLKEQGPHAPGGARSYIQDGKMTGGFAVLAYPAGYRSSGVMSFMAGQDGTLYQKDLGPQTGTIAASIKAFDPDKTWEAVPPQDEAGGNI